MQSTIVKSALFELVDRETRAYYSGGEDLQRRPYGEYTESLIATADAIVDWHACLDPDAECFEIDGSHCGMAVNTEVYRELERLLRRSEGQ